MPSCEHSFQWHVQSHPASFNMLQCQQTSPRNEREGATWVTHVATHGAPGLCENPTSPNSYMQGPNALSKHGLIDEAINVGILHGHHNGLRS
jgi:hypothetical protein